MIVSSVAGGLGWWIGNFFGIAVAIVLSMFTSVLGLALGQKWNREYFE
jgi:hypothetical protein